MVVTPLSNALLTGQPYHVIELLLSCGADINNDPVIWKTGWVSRLVRTGDVELLELLLYYGMDPNAIADSQWCLLGYALRYRDDICVATLLLKYRANIVLPDGTDMIWIAYYSDNSIEKISLLLGYGSDINTVDEHGWTMLHHAACIGHVDVVRWLSDHGAKSDIRCSKGELPVHKAIHHDGPDVMEIIGLLGGFCYIV